MTQYYLGPLEEPDVQLLTEGIVSEAVKSHARCCDCGLIHRHNFRVRANGAIQFQTFRDPKATNSLFGDLPQPASEVK